MADALGIALYTLLQMAVDKRVITDWSVDDQCIELEQNGVRTRIQALHAGPFVGELISAGGRDAETA